MSEELYHVGVGHEKGGHSGRHPWGSGDNPYQHEENPWLKKYRECKAKGMSEKEIADTFGMKTTEVINRRSILEGAEKAAKLARIESLKAEGHSNVEIGRLLDMNESSIRSILNNAEKIKHNKAMATADVIRKAVNEKGYIDIGSGVERELGITRTKLDVAVEMLKDEGYAVHTVKVRQLTNPNQRTNVKVIAPEGTTWAEIQNNLQEVHSLNAHSSDGGASYTLPQYPSSLDSKRIYIRYAEDGGVEKDGLIELRRNKEDISLGGANYAQIRAAVDDQLYLKGMAIYSDDIPEGYDIVFNTNKKKGTPKEKVYKPLKGLKVQDDGSITGEVEKDNPFGAALTAAGQRYFKKKNGDFIKNEKGSYDYDPDHKIEGDRYSLSPINKLKDDGYWDDYSRTVASQFLAKQSKALVKQQLDISYGERKTQFDDIMSLTNPTIRKNELLEFAKFCDSNAVDLKATAMPGQSAKVLLPLNVMKDNEVYAPTYPNGTILYLVRYPHGGTFEIPRLVVNNKKSARDILGNPIDAIGINHKVAERLSGADFDGDSVMVLPEPKRGAKITSTPSLKGLKDFDPKDAYPERAGMKVLTEDRKGWEMGVVTNLITDMTVKGAPENDIVKAVKHSMVVIDAAKHHLDYKRSEIENDIPALKKKYQEGGASSIISRAKSQAIMPERKNFRLSDIDKETGEIHWRNSGRMYRDKNGNLKEAVFKSTKMYETNDARTLISKAQNPKELLYADYANRLKFLANQARKEALRIKENKADPSAAKVYVKEVESLKSKLNLALLNAPKEREALNKANIIVRTKFKNNPNLTKEEKKKIKQQAMANARVITGANKKRAQIYITDAEWKAIQNNAISPTKLSQIIANTDKDRLKELAMPNLHGKMPASKVSRAKTMVALGYSYAEIAKALNVSPSTISKALSGKAS